jgi:UDP-glucose 4-epimerase
VKVLITGGAGFIGSTIASACIDEGIVPVILDDLSAGREEFTEGRAFYRGDIADGALVDRVFADHPDIAATVHCAAHIVVPESVADPLRYYRNNVCKTISLVEHLIRNDSERLVFSSSASIYTPGADLTVDESSGLDPQSPYASSKMLAEHILRDTTVATALRVLSLRYFNPVGADPRMRTGLQLPAPSHALGRLIDSYMAGEPFTVTGTDWPTRDGSGIRDYIHVWDLAAAHVAALRAFDDVVTSDRPYEVVNLGTGTGTTVRELVSAFQTVVGGEARIVETAARPGDVIGGFTRTEKAERLLGWKAGKSVEDGVRDSLEWVSRRPSVLGF